MAIPIYIHEDQSKLEFWGIYQFFPRKLEPPINLAQIQTQFASYNFNSNSIRNLNIIPK
jgi:hypothetical protein